MNGANKGTRMPDVSLKEETIEAKVKEATPIPEGKMFKKKNNLSLEVKDVKVLDDIAEEPMEPKEPVKKAKKKLTEKQLEALKRGREKSIETRRAKREALKQEKQSQKQALKESNAEVMKMESMESHSAPQGQQMMPPQGQQMMPPQMMMGQGQWDYDKIIRGLADEQDKRSKARENREHQVAEDIKKYENQIRQDERARILAEVEAEEQQEIQQKNTQKTHSIFNPQIPVNAYSRTSYNSFGRSRRNF